MRNQLTFGQRFLFGTILTIIILSFWAGCLGCASYKEFQGARSSKDSISIKQKDDSLRLLKSVIATMETEKRLQDYSGFDFDIGVDPKYVSADSVKKPCDTKPVIIPANCNADSILNLLNATRNKVTFYADGKVEAEGKLKRAYRTSDQLWKENLQMINTIDSLKSIKTKESTSVSEKSETVKTKKKRPQLKWYIFFCIAGMYAEHRWKLITGIISIFRTPNKKVFP